MKVLVTGGAGFIGSHLVEALVLAGDDVTVVDDFSRGTKWNLTGVRDKIHVRCADVLTIGHNLAWGRDVIYHLAADVSVVDSVDLPARLVTRNILGTLRVLEAARIAHRPRVVFASSCAAAHNANPYAASKRSGEVLCEMYANTFGLESIALRFFNVYGPRQRADLPNPPAIAAFVKAACEDESIKIHGDGSQRRDFVFVDDVVDVLMELREDQMTEKYSVMEVGTGITLAINTVAGMVMAEAGTTKKHIRAPSRDGDPTDVDAAESLDPVHHGLTESPKTLPLEGIRRTVEWYRRTHANRKTDVSDAG